jgi:hypothetical protein
MFTSNNGDRKIMGDKKRRALAAELAKGLKIKADLN